MSEELTKYYADRIAVARAKKDARLLEQMSNWANHPTKTYKWGVVRIVESESAEAFNWFKTERAAIAWARKHFVKKFAIARYYA
jgi:hypothetical protein